MFDNYFAGSGKHSATETDSTRDTDGGRRSEKDRERARKPQSNGDLNNLSVEVTARENEREMEYGNSAGSSCLRFTSVPFAERERETIYFPLCRRLNAFHTSGYHPLIPLISTFRVYLLVALSH